jgi:hypothetical protein
MVGVQDEYVFGGRIGRGWLAPKEDPEEEETEEMNFP